MCENNEETSAAEGPSVENYIPDNAEQHNVTASGAGFLSDSLQHRNDDPYSNDHH